MFSNYNHERYNPTAVELPPPGRYNASIESASETYSKAGNTMIKVVFSLSGKNTKIFHYFVDNEYIQRKLDQFYNSFNIQPGNFDLQSWLGKTGDIQVVHEEQNGFKNARVHYFYLRKAKPETLSYSDESGTTYDDTPETFVATDDDVPF